MLLKLNKKLFLPKDIVNKKKGILAQCFYLII